MEFLPTAGLIAAYTLAVLALNFTPGPDMAMFVGTAITRGRRAGFAAFLGTSSGILVHTLLVVFGLAALIAASPLVFDALKVAGALYLLYLAVGILRHGSRFAPEAPAPGSPVRLYLKGLAVNVLNPKVALFFLTFLPQFVEPGDPAARGKLLFLGVWFLAVSTLSMTPLILGASGVAAFLKARPKAMRVIDYVFAGVMGAFAVRLVTARL
ncbi:LysE family translocator [Pleomorphomonas koreensis]|uniref:LysE family translocator n=1 Tax=Pleomorphomonas koreensis TaxID=257440 RepID=UPI0004251035|nr:LysE family translocator [Pleomorphomonas koreensis]